MAVGGDVMMTQSTLLDSEYLMTLHAAMDPPQQIDETLRIFPVSGGWVKGPKINATIIQPAGDWLTFLPNGSGRIDVRLTLKTDDAALIYVSYNGVIRQSQAARERLGRGETITSNDSYGMTAPTFRTSHANYAWLNAVQSVGKVLELKMGNGSYIKYDVFAVK